MKKTKRMLASILASSLAVMSLPFFGLSASANREMVTDANEIVADSNLICYDVIAPFDNYSQLYCNRETKTAFTILKKDLPDDLYWLVSDIDRFKDGMKCILPSDIDDFKFVNADITVAKDSMYIVNHGAIVYVDDNGEEHSFSSFSDVEDYIIHTYNVTFVDYETVKENNKVEYPAREWKYLTSEIRNIERGNSLYLYCNDETKTAFTFYTADVPHGLQFLITVSGMFNDNFGFNIPTKYNLKFPDAEVTVFDNRMDVTNHGSIVYVDDNGDEHTFSGYKDVENYIIQNYDTTAVVDYDKYVEDGSIVPVDAVTTPDNNTTATSYFTGDVTGDGAVDLTDAISLNKIFAGMITPTNVQTTAADINQDGSVTDEDLSILMQFLIGVRTDLTDVD